MSRVKLETRNKKYMGIKYFMLFISGFILTCFLFSCSKEDNDDNTPPSFEILALDSTATYPLSLSDGDTLYYFMDQDSIFNRIRIRFKDDKALSSYNIRIRGLNADATDIVKDTSKVDTVMYPGDTVVYAYWKKNYQSQAIYGKTDKTIIQSVALDTTTQVSYIDSKNELKYKLRQTWMKGPYQLKLSVADIQGNETVAYYKIFLARKYSSNK